MLTVVLMTDSKALSTRLVHLSIITTKSKNVFFYATKSSLFLAVLSFPHFLMFKMITALFQQRQL